MAFWGASGSPWPRGWEGSFCPWVPSFLLVPRVLPGDARWGSWGESRALGVLGTPPENHPSSPLREQVPGRTQPWGG